MRLSLKQSGFIAVIAVLIVAIIGVSFLVMRNQVETNPSGGIEVLTDKQASDGRIVIKDLYNGEMEIPKYDIPISQYSKNKFVEESGIITYGDNYAQGITVHSNLGDIDWEQVAGAGIDFVMIRVGYRNYNRGDIQIDEKFEQNIQGAADAGLDIGVYFYSQAISTLEAEQEAEEVLERIKSYSITYPVAIVWEFVTNPKEGVTPRTQNCTKTEITSYINAFCDKVKKTGYKAAYSATKTMGYEEIDISKLTAYDLWYYEYRSAPSFYYDFKMWLYSTEGTVPGISESNSVSMTLAMNKYSKS